MSDTRQVIYILSIEVACFMFAMGVVITPWYIGVLLGLILGIMAILGLFAGILGLSLILDIIALIKRRKHG